jgi:N-acetylneuraminic acid mutarotase
MWCTVGLAVLSVGQLAACGNGGSGGGLGLDPSGSGPAWEVKASMPTPRMDLGVVVVNGKIYAIGGFSGSTLAINEEYDPASNAWSTKAPMADARRLFVVAEVNGKIYAIGGMNFVNVNNGTYVLSTEEYDPSTNTWTKMADLPMDNPPNGVVGNAFMGGAAVGGKIYVVIFNTSTPGTTATYEFDPSANAWDKTKSPVPMSYTRYSAASINNALFALATDAPVYWNSGFTAGAPLAKYDPTQDIWVTQPSTRVPRRFHSVGAIDGRLLVAGGERYAGSSQGIATFQESGVVEVFDPGSGQWSLGRALTVPRQSAGVATVNNTVYVIGGGTSDSVPLAAVEAATFN